MKNSDIEVKRLSGDDVHRYIKELAELRIDIFRNYPYLYEGDLGYEERYLERYLESDQSVLVVALRGDEVMGVSTGMPMAEADEDFQRPFNELGYDTSKIFYFSESVLRRECRGQGIGVRFFDEREAHVRKLGGFEWTCFAAVLRSPDHPDKPEDYTPLHEFWRHRGYSRHTELRTTIKWKLVGQTEEVAQVMEFWMKHLED